MIEPTVDDVRRYLAELPELCALLPDAAVTRAPHSEGSRAVPGPKPPCRLDVLHLLDTRDKGWAFDVPPDPDRVGVLPFLDSWARDLEATALDERPELPEELPDPPTVAGLCKWLTGEALWASGLPQWPELASGLHQTWKAVRMAVRAVRDEQPQPVPCIRCGGPLGRVDGELPRWECRDCGHAVNMLAVTVADGARRVGVSRSKLYDLLAETPVPRIRDGQKMLYDLGAIRRVVAQWRFESA